MKKISILTAVLLGLGTAGVLAQENNDGPRGQRPGGPGQGRPNPEEMLKRLDKNSDGKISKDEAPERMAQNFENIDKNSDGFITQNELKPPGGPGGPGGQGGQGGQGGGRPNPDEMFKRLDKNSDGKISKDEAPERMAQNFDKLDKNSDGSLTKDELPRPGGPGGQGGPRGPGQGEGHAGPPPGPRGPGPEGDQP
jgi:hypothetical protein